MVFGKVAASPTTMSEKNTPMDSDEPAFWTVPAIPEAEPRCEAGTEFMIVARLGEANIAEPIPFRKVIAANAG